ncbi:MAG: beta-galactosidase [Verrucomicrobiota bacterium]
MIASLVCVGIDAFAARDSDAEWRMLNDSLDQESRVLAELIAEGEKRGVTTDYARVSADTIDVFRQAAQQDVANVERTTQIFSGYWHLRDQAASEAESLASNELRACLEVAGFAVHQLQQQLAKEVVLPEPPDLSKGKIAIGPGYFELNGRPVFPSSLVWMADSDNFAESYGRIGQVYYALSMLEPSGEVHPRSVASVAKRAAAQAERNLSPAVLFLGHNPSGWMVEGHPEIQQGGRRFTQYDIDSPLIREWMGQLTKLILPAVSRGFGDRPQIHLLANEPHFSTTRGGWLANNGLSDYTVAKYHDWLAEKYQSIDELNRIYDSNFAGFEDVEIFALGESSFDGDDHRVRQVDETALRGGPQWYDWCRFNQSRVNEWFSFLKDMVQSHDGVQAPVTIKMLGYSIARNTREGGIDVEYLMDLQEVIGADLRTAPASAIFAGRQEDGLGSNAGWRERYAYDWVEQSMFLDFARSLYPERPFYDSEWHGFSSVNWRDFNLSREYVRSALWLAFAEGMSMIKPWLWGRNADGSLQDRADHIGELSTQPVALDAYGRTMKELNANAEWLVELSQRQRHVLIYYVEESAIQDPTYIDNMVLVYESLKLLNLPVGFTTPNRVGALDSAEQVVLVTPTKFISDRSLDALTSFKRVGGNIVQVGDNFQKTELGFPRADRLELSTENTVASGDREHYQKVFRERFALLASRTPLASTIVDEHGRNRDGVMIEQVWLPETSHIVVLLNNLSKEPRIVNLSNRRSGLVEGIDLFSGRKLAVDSILLQPCEVRALSIYP